MNDMRIHHDMRSNINDNIMKHAASFASAVVLVGGLGGCASMTPAEKGTAIGAAVGAVAGSALTGGSTAGTLGGAAAGGIIGHEVQKNR